MRYCTSPAKAAPSPTQPLRLHGRDPPYIALKVSASSMLPPPERTGHTRSSLTSASRLSAQRERQHGTRGDGLASMLEQGRRDGPGLDDRISPVIERDHLRQQLGTEAVTVAADPVDLQLFAHHATASAIATGRPTAGARCTQKPRWCAAQSSAKTPSALRKSPVAPSGCLQAPRPASWPLQRAIRFRSSGCADRAANRRQAASMAPRPNRHGPHWRALWEARYPMIRAVASTPQVSSARK